ncbi:hypothetical protein UlMin_015539 [Ulmus minor]
MEILRKPIRLMILMVMIKLSSVGGRNPVLHRVGGGRFTWNPNHNFTDWSINEKFYVGDWLYFGFDRNLYNVLEVNKTSYENCNDKDFITNITRGGRDVFNLTEGKTYYFMSGRGYCFQGMKLAVPVKEILTAPQPVFINNRALSSFAYHKITIVISMLAPTLYYY